MEIYPKRLLCFDLIKEPDIVSWTSIIGALGFHGFAEESLRTFETMLRKRKLNQKISFSWRFSLLGGLVQEGIHYFKQMTEVIDLQEGILTAWLCIYLINAEHYACLIDLLGRADLIDEAFNFLTSMPTELSRNALAAFTGACNIHEKRGETMKWCAKKLLEIKPCKSVNYSVLSNA